MRCKEGDFPITVRNGEYPSAVELDTLLTDLDKEISVLLGACIAKLDCDGEAAASVTKRNEYDSLSTTRDRFAAESQQG